MILVAENLFSILRNSQSHVILARVSTLSRKDAQIGRKPQIAARAGTANYMPTVLQGVIRSRQLILGAL
jgi:hypothetical protein